MLPKKHYLDIFTVLAKIKVASLGLLTSFFLFACHASQPVVSQFDTDLSIVNKGDVVILLHGMYRDARAMRPLERYLDELGYKTINLSYPSTEFNIETLAKDYLHPELQIIDLEQGQKVHFVTHSMGGILARSYLKDYSLEQVGRVVMIAPPNKGTPLADLFNDSSWIKTKYNPAKLQIGVQENSWVNQLGPVNFELGVIAGNYNKNWVTDFLLPGEDDGVVSVENTRIDNMKDFVTVPEKHYRLRANELVLQQVAYFLKYGKFYKGELELIMTEASNTSKLSEPHL